MEEFPKFAVITIEGGGAFGFNLLGQLQAIEDQKIVPVAFAGTSAGAIIATLRWAGYTPIEIQDKFCELADQGLITQLMGPFDLDADGKEFNFAAFEKLHAEVQRLLSGDQLPQPRKRSRFANFFYCCFTPVRWLFSPITWCCVRLSWCVMAASAMRRYSRLKPQVQKRGFFSGESLVDRIDDWLRRAPILDYGARQELERERQRPEKVTFADIAKVTQSRPLSPLFLPVTNVSSRKLELVCSVDPNYANWPIARAARASAGFPIFFHPVSFGHAPQEYQYADGGVIANYPAWVFGHQFRQKLYSLDSTREIAIHPWVHIGLCLGPPSTPVPDDDRGRTPSSYFKCFGRLLAGGARQALEKQLVSLVSRTIEVRQPEDETDAPESLLDFACCDRHKVTKMFKRGTEAAKSVLDQIDFSLPPSSEVSPRLEKLIKKISVCLGEVNVNGETNNDRFKLRANVFMPTAADIENWGIRYAVNMDEDPDRNMTLPKFSGLTGLCVNLRTPLICNLQEIQHSAVHGTDTRGLFSMTRALQNQVRNDRTWLASVPIFDQLASYPTRMGQPVHQPEGQFYQNYEFPRDGAIIAVLNVDAALPFAELGLDPHPQRHWTDDRIQSIIDIMRAVADELGSVFSSAFARPKAAGRER